MKQNRRSFLKKAVGAAAIAQLGFPAIASSRPASKSVLVLGIDGMDHVLLMKYIRTGLMPNCKKLIDSGFFSPIISSNPSQSPVAWSNFISGCNPGEHGIFDFIAREASTLTPYLSTSRVSGNTVTVPFGKWNLPLARGKVENLRHGPTFWNVLEDHGINSTIIKMPTEFPPTPAGKTISGLGTPDIHGSYGIFSFYTDEPGTVSSDVSGGRIESVRVIDNKAECVLNGPENTFHDDRPAVNINFQVTIDPENPAALISIQGQRILLGEGEWSKWITLQFQMIPGLARTSAICRFYLKKTRKPFQLYVSPVNIDPANPSMPVSHPSNYSSDLVRSVGKFYTQGMAEDTSALSAGVLNDDEFRTQALMVLDENLRIFDHEFNRFRKGFYFHYISTLDLCSHAFWRTMDTGHPLYNESLERKQGDFIPLLYSRMDRLIGLIMRNISEETTLIVVSDHGFGSFRRQFNLNSWLMDNGYAERAHFAADRESPYFGCLQWNSTKAYGLGINSLYINTRDREPEGCVADGEEKENLKEELIKRLTSVQDPETGTNVITNVYRPTDIYSGSMTSTAPDLIIGYNKNYRASWDTILGKYPKEHILDNTDPWSGDHTMDSMFVPGVFMINRKTAGIVPRLEDAAPTILKLFGAPIPKQMTGKSIV